MLTLAVAERTSSARMPTLRLSKFKRSAQLRTWYTLFHLLVILFDSSVPSLTLITNDAVRFQGRPEAGPAGAPLLYEASAQEVPRRLRGMQEDQVQGMCTRGATHLVHGSTRKTLTSGSVMSPSRAVGGVYAPVGPVSMPGPKLKHAWMSRPLCSLHHILGIATWLYSKCKSI